jgi:hypothetical protein
MSKYIIIMADDVTGPSEVKKHCSGKPSESGEQQSVEFFL